MTNCAHEGKYFYFEVLYEGDDVYYSNTLLITAQDTPNIILESERKDRHFFITNEFDLRTWNNDAFKQFIDNISNAKDDVFKCGVKDDGDTVVSVQMSFKNNILTIPIHEGKYCMAHLNLKVDKSLCDELLFIHSKINK